MRQPFAFLTEQGRARRMRPLAFAALEQYDLEVRRMRLVSNEMNCTFRVDAADDRSYAIRISVPDLRTLDQSHAEVDWLRALTEETDISVSRPIPNRAGEYVVVAGADGVPEQRRCVLFEWLRGRPVSDRPTDANMLGFGRIAARLHEHGAIYRPPKPESIRRMDHLYPMGDVEMLLDESTRELLPDEGYARLLEMRAAVERELAWLFSRGEPPRVLHGDFHWDNVMVERGILRPIDFEDLCLGYPVQDIAISAYYTNPGAHYERFRTLFRAGYEEIAPWPERYPGQLELHMVHRALDLFNFVLGSTYRHDRDLLEHFIKRIQGDHWRMYEIWKSSFDERFYA